MAKLRILLTHYGPVFSHGLIAGALLALTIHSGLSGG